MFISSLRTLVVTGKELDKMSSIKSVKFQKISFVFIKSGDKNYRVKPKITLTSSHNRKTM